MRESRPTRYLHAQAVHLVEILLPLYDRGGEPIPRSRFDEVRRELVESFGGVTVHARAPASGLWKNERGAVERDDIVVFEVITATLEREWWRGYRRALETRFEQESIVVRASEFEAL